MTFREETIVECSGAPIEFVGDRRAAIIYAISPRGGGNPVYIGSTSQILRDRIRGHVLDTRTGSPLPIHCWIRSQLNGFRVEVLERCDDRPSVRAAREKHWVAQFDSLLNVTDGGLGGSGTTWPEERRERLAAAIRSGQTFECQNCGRSFWRKRRDIIKGHNKFCSRACYQQSLRGKSRPIPEHVRQRGVDAAAKRKRARTHCPNGHPFTDDNTRVNKNGARICRTCERAAKRKYLEAAHV